MMVGVLTLLLLVSKCADEREPITLASTETFENAKELETITVNGVSFDMVRVEGGSFEMGSDDPDADENEKPVHNETVEDFYIGSTEVTQDLWVAVMGSNPSNSKGGLSGIL